MSGKGGRTSTTWDGGTWRAGKTKVIRIPEALEAQVMAYARHLDSDNAVLHGNVAVDEQQIILNAIANYTRLRAARRHNNQHSKQLDTAARTWDELRKFAALVEKQPEKIGLQDGTVDN